MAKEREAMRSLWRTLYHKTSMWSRKIANTSSNAAALVPPDVEAPSDINDFLDVLLVNFEAGLVVNLQALYDFKHNPRESLHMLGTRFNLIANLMFPVFLPSPSFNTSQS